MTQEPSPETNQHNQPKKGMTMTTAIPFLVKVFDQEQYAQAFMKGEIYADALSHFREIEDEARQDDREGALLFGTRDLTLSLWPEDTSLRAEIGALQARREDLAEPLAMFPNNYKRFNLFCMYAKKVNESDLPKIDADHLHELKKMFQVPVASLAKFGKHAVVVNRPKVFVERVKLVATKSGYQFGYGLVDYNDPDESWPVLDPLDPKGIFVKRARYAPESEYRMVFGRQLYSTEPITLQVGNISDVAYRADVSTINDGIEVEIRRD